MAILGTNYLTLADKLKRSEKGDGKKMAYIIEMLSQTNEILDDAITVEGNLTAGHRTTVRTGLPTATFRKYYGGVQPSKSTVTQIDDTCGMLTAMSEVDKDLADLNANTGAFRLSESAAFMEAMSQKMAQYLIYGNTKTEPEAFLGLAPRYAASSTDKTKIGYNVIKASDGAGDANTSIYLATWGERSMHLISPMGSKTGLVHKDLGSELTDAPDGNGKYEAYMDLYKWNVGLTLRDWRGTSRICNIKAADIAAGTVELEKWLIKAYYRTRKIKGVKAIYCNEEIMEALHLRAMNKDNLQLRLDEFEGKPIVKFLGIPIREVEAILNTEEAVA